MDDIIFASSNEQMYRDIEGVMRKKLEMSAMGELSYFLGLQVEQQKEGSFILQAKYVRDILKWFRMEDASTFDTPIQVNHKLSQDTKNDKCVDPSVYRAMIGSLMYLTASRPDIMFPICLCARFQCNAKEGSEANLQVLEGSAQTGALVSSCKWI